MTSRFDGRYAKEFLAGWGTMDANGHMGNTSYLDMAADVRMAFFAEHGFPPAEFRRIELGPVVQKEEIEYFREFGLRDSRSSRSARRRARSASSSPRATAYPSRVRHRDRD